MNQDRRAFLRKTATTVLIFSSAGALVRKLEASQTQSRVFSGGKDRSVPSDAGWLAISDVEGNLPTRKVLLPFTPHKIELHPQDRNLAFCAGKWGKSAALIHLEEGAFRTIDAPEGVRFFGHCVFDPSGNSIYCSAMDDLKKEGVLLVLGSRDLRAVRRYATGNLYPHDCKYLPDHGAIAVANSGDQGSSLVWIRASDGARIKTIPIPWTDWGKGINHFEISEDGFVILSGVRGHPEYTPPLALITPKEEVIALPLPQSEAAALRGEALSIAVDSRRGIVGITVPDAGKVCFWNYRSPSWIKALEFPVPQGIALSPDRSHYLVTDKQAGAFRAIDAVTLKENSEFNKAKALGANGSHLTIA